MVVGKPDFNLNSYGIKYFQKGEDSLENSEQDNYNQDRDSETKGIKVPKISETIGGSGTAAPKKAPKAKPKPKVGLDTKLTPEQESTFDRRHANYLQSGGYEGKTGKKDPSTQFPFHKPSRDDTHPPVADEKTDYYYNESAPVNNYLGEPK